MSRKSSIPPNLEPEVLAKAGENWSLQRIATWLHAERSIKTSPQGVMRLLDRLKKERQPIRDAVLEKKLSETLTTDIEAVAGVLGRALEDEARARGALDAVDSGEDSTATPLLAAGSLEWARCMGAASAARADLLRSLELRFKLGGAGIGDLTINVVNPYGEK